MCGSNKNYTFAAQKDTFTDVSAYETSTLSNVISYTYYIC
ncbi:hypothetical protein HMPREF9303_1374 [Prevotella denticola CRIS 18C-A]|uniref:Uncharacterized protein n=1 Tax=Prevotella denticola CRIS 18C-A TaxID=944557 RepID=F0H7F9_9BACT|nr:hypothetical protein HMPREF9303_1374 [Prevotella denticola CRIS 18C-A]